MRRPRRAIAVFETLTNGIFMAIAISRKAESFSDSNGQYIVPKEIYARVQPVCHLIPWP